jgi:archaellum component FlaC
LSDLKNQVEAITKDLTDLKKSYEKKIRILKLKNLIKNIIIAGLIYDKYK